MSNDQIFSQQSYDLGNSTEGYDRTDVSNMFESMYLGTPYTPKCCVCGQPPMLQLVPKPTSGIHIGKPEDALVCEHCVKGFNPELFGIRPLKR